MNSAMAGRLGCTREEMVGMNVSRLLEPESWIRSREQIVAQLGGGGPQQLDLTAIASDGSRVRLAVVRRLLFERGRPVAIQDRDACWAASPIPAITVQDRRKILSPGKLRLHPLCRTAKATTSAKHHQLHHFGPGPPGPPGNRLPAVPSARGPIAASGRLPRRGASFARRGGSEGGVLIPLWQRGPPYGVTTGLRTVTASEPALGSGGPRTEFETYIGTPVWLGAELFATLSFSGPFHGATRKFSHSDRELIELMARSIGRVVLEHRIQSERDRLQAWKKTATACSKWWPKTKVSIPSWTKWCPYWRCSALERSVP